MRKIILITAVNLAYCILHTASCFSQGTAINTNGSAADSSAMLDVNSTTKGLLIPRMTIAQRNSIPAPATSLLIYQTDGTTPGYYFNAGSGGSPQWVYAGSDNMGNHTATDSLNMSMKKIYNLATCTQNLDAANKEYVDGKVGAGGSGGCCVPSFISDESLSTMNLAAAASYCRNLSESSYSDWYLPTYEEIWHAVSFTSGPVNNPTSNYLWTASFSVGSSASTIMWCIVTEISSGNITYKSGTDLMKVRCVR